MKNLLLSSIFVLNSAQALACSKYLPEPKEFGNFDSVILGKVVSLRDNLNLLPGEVSFVSDLDMEIETIKHYAGKTIKTAKLHLEECASPIPKAGDVGIFFVMDEGNSISIFKTEESFYKEWMHQLERTYGQL